MATYAAVVSLMNTMDAAMNDPRISTCFHRQQIQSLGENLDVLLQLIENYDFNSLRRDQEVQGLEGRIRSAAHAAEDVIESHIVAQVNAGVLEDAPTSCIDLHQIMHDIDEIKEEVVKVAEDTGSNNQTPNYSPQPRQTAGKMTMIGFDDYLIQLLHGLTGSESESGRQVIPIVGMGGVGKTTLTKNAYEHELTVQHFDVHVWVSISQQYDVKNILIQILSNLGQSTHGNNEPELIDRLFKYFWRRRYIVVLDDMWSIIPWEEIQFCFPVNSNGSRIIVTTRQLEVANGFRSSRVIRVGLLDDYKSWDLFCDRAFAQHGGTCPNELEKIGKTIVKKCKGLPLSIVVIAALLGRSPQTKAYWGNIAQNMSSILSSSGDEGCLDILCLSYNHLPSHLKPCFLYLGIFSEDRKILVSVVIKLWISEGFIKPNKDEMLLEDVAEGYVNDLLERSLILVDSLGWNKKFSSFRIHDLVRDMCLREAQKEKFYFVISRKSSEQKVEVERGIVHHQRWWREMNDSYSLTSTVSRSLICERYPPRLYGSKLLRVCVVNNSGFDVAKYFNYFQNVNTRLICCMENDHSFYTDLPRSIFRLWNLQALILNDYSLESLIELWKMRQLRHIEFGRITLSEPPLSDDEDEFVVLHNLQTLMQVQDFRCSEEVCKRIPNIKRLKVYYDDFSKNSNDYFCLQNFCRLNKLEFLSFNFGTDPHLLQNLKLPTSLKELSLLNSFLDWDNLTIIGSLPNLEVLTLFYVEFSEGFEWNCVEGEFRALKILEIWGTNLITWNAERCHFPVLDTLSLVSLDSMEEIPWGIGDIPTLRIVRLLNCNTSLVISTMKMLEEQENELGNDQIHVELEFYLKHKMNKMMEEVKKEAITCTNFSYKIRT